MKYVKPVKLYEAFFKQSLQWKKNLDLLCPLMAMNISERRVSFARTLHCKTIVYIGAVARNDNNMGPVLIGLQKCISDLKPKGLIVGYPKFLSKEKPNGEEINIFIDYLRHTGLFEGLKYTYWHKHIPKEKKVSLFRFQPNFDDAPMNLLKAYLDCFRMEVGAAKLYGDYKKIRSEDI
ncbi:hypothetical protein EZV62_004394 [Acer yangbiense]|uniref:Uncharacterized protein n=1 Tax=Acer yangbiense TaxID=1000413 RepID=A0A5C7IK44_9ROSI|nr:hypothetical protein EZV62_004394 [Acer yangbiense]